MLLNIARFAMQGIWQPVLLCALFFLGDITSWISLSIVALLVLRQGVQSVGLVCLAMLAVQLIPGIGLRLVDVLTLAAVIASAVVLRSSRRLSLSVLVATFLSCLGLALVNGYIPVVLEPFIADLAQAKTLMPSLANYIVEDPHTYILRSLASWITIKTLVVLLLARYWQSALYYPEGFAQEFLSLRLAKVEILLWLLLVVAVEFLPQPWSGLSSALRLPLFLAGLACSHWLFKRFEVKAPWRFLFYGLLLVIHPLVLALAVIDSLIHVRQRVPQLPLS